MIFENFKLTEFTRHDSITPDVADKIIRYHISQIQPIRTTLGVPIHVTSGYRTEEHELSKGRSGESEHVYRGKGAADYACSDMSGLLQNLWHETDYTRITYYPAQNFVHCDYKFPERGRRLFLSTVSGWEQVSGIHKLLEHIGR